MKIIDDDGPAETGDPCCFVCSIPLNSFADVGGEDEDGYVCKVCAAGELTPVAVTPWDDMVLRVQHPDHYRWLQENAARAMVRNMGQVNVEASRVEVMALLGGLL